MKFNINISTTFRASTISKLIKPTRYQYKIYID